MRRFAIVEMSPFRSPAWRWQLALGFLQGRERRLSRWDDPWFRRAVRHLRSLGVENSRTRRAARPDQAVAEALAIFQASQPSRSLRVEARVLAAQTPAEIAAVESLPPGAVAAYEALFFDVRSKLHADIYIRNHAIGLDPDTAQPRSWPAFVRAAAFEGGPQVLDAAFQSALPIPPGTEADPLRVRLRCLWLVLSTPASAHSPLVWKQLENAMATRPGLETRNVVDPAVRLAELIARSSAADRCAEAELASQNCQVG